MVEKRVSQSKSLCAQLNGWLFSGLISLPACTSRLQAFETFAAVGPAHVGGAPQTFHSTPEPS